MERIVEEAGDARDVTAPTPGQTRRCEQDDLSGSASDDATVLAVQELHSHAQIAEMLQSEDVYTVSTLLRCEMQDFLPDAEAPDAPNAEDGESVCARDLSFLTDARSSVSHRSEWGRRSERHKCTLRLIRSVPPRFHRPKT